MKTSVLFIGLILSLGLYELSSALALNVFWDGQTQKAELTEDRTAAGVSSQASVKCKLRGTARLPAFSMDGDYVIGGVFSIHYYTHTVKHNYTTMPEPVRCTGRLVRARSGGKQCYTVLALKCLYWYDVLTIMLRRFYIG